MARSQASPRPPPTRPSPEPARSWRGPGHGGFTVRRTGTQGWLGSRPGLEPGNSASQPTVFRRPSLYRSCQKRTGRHICSRALYRGRRWLTTKLWGQACHAEGPTPTPHRQAWPPVYRCSCLWAPRIWPGHGAGTSCREGRWQGRGRGLHSAPVHGAPQRACLLTAVDVPPPGLALAVLSAGPLLLHCRRCSRSCTSCRKPAAPPRPAAVSSDHTAPQMTRLLSLSRTT